MTWRRNASGWQVVRWTAASHVVSRARTADLHGDHRGGARRQRLVPPSAQHRSRFLDGDVRLGPDARLERPSRRLGRRRRTATASTICTSPSRPDCPIACTGIAATRPSRTSPTTRASASSTTPRQSLFADVDNDGDEDLVLATATKPLLFLNDGKGHFTPSTDAFRFAQPLQGVLTSITHGGLRPGRLSSTCICASTRISSARARTRRARRRRTTTRATARRACSSGTTATATSSTRRRTPASTPATIAITSRPRGRDYDGDGWPDLLVANDFGTKNLYRNLGRRDGKVRFEDVAAAAGVLDHGAGMSATFLDYDNDGLLDIYTGNMWSAPGQRVTSAPTFMPDATPEVRALYRRHVRGNSLLRNLGDGRFEDKTIEAHAEMGRWAWSSDAFDFDSDGWDDLYIVNGMLTRQRDARGGERGRSGRPRRILLATGRRALAAHARAGHAVRRCVARDQSAADSRVDRQPAAQRVPAQRRTWRLRRDLRRARARPRSGRPIVRGARLDRRRRPGPRRDGRAPGAAAADLPQRFRVTRLALARRRACAGVEEQSRCDRRPRHRRDRSHAPDEDRAGGIRIPVAALEGAAHRARRERAHRRA